MSLYKYGLYGKMYSRYVLSHKYRQLVVKSSDVTYFKSAD